MRKRETSEYPLTPDSNNHPMYTVYCIYGIRDQADNCQSSALRSRSEAGGLFSIGWRDAAHPSCVLSQ
eukprot:3500255-Pleurochrysis_carterae.AAC.2